MHGISMVKNIIAEVENYLQTNAIQNKVEKIYLKVGREAEIGPESLPQIFNALTSGTDFENVELNIEVIPGKEIAIDSIEIAE